MDIQLKGTRIFYEECGNGAQPLLFLHGWGMSGANWKELAHHFPPHQWRAILPDLRGFGRSDKPRAGYHIDNYMQDAIRLIRALQLGPVDVIGHSFGGTGALYLAARVPHLVKRLVVFDTIPGAKAPAIDPRIFTQFDRIRRLVNKVSDSDLPKLLNRIWHQSFVHRPAPWLDALQSQVEAHAQRHAVLQTLTTILTTDISQYLPRIKAPTLIFRGESDPLLKSSSDGLEVIPNARRVTIPYSGHYPHLENLEAVWMHLAPFLGVLTASPGGHLGTGDGTPD